MDEWLFLLETLRASWLALGRPRRVTAAVSGGADSVALLHALAALAKTEGFSLSAAHVDHGLRDSSREDARFTASMCEKMGIPCRTVQVFLSKGSEEAARNARYQALMEACLQAGSSVLALAHHQRDQAETLLLHLFRGGGGQGLAAMEERVFRPFGGQRICLWRPMLSFPADAVRPLLERRGIPWREDETNAQDRFSRNYLRQCVLPLIRARFPQAEEAMSRSAGILSLEQDFFQGEARAFLEKHACLSGPCRWIDDPALRRMHPAMQRQAVRAACPVALDHRKTEALLALSPGETENLPENWRALRTCRYLHFLAPFREEAPLGPIRRLPRNGQTGDGKRLQAMPLALFEQCTLRTRRPGDRIHPLGAPGEKSLQDYFVDKRIDRPFRDHIPLLCLGKRVVWAIGCGPGEEARVSPEDNSAVFLKYDGYIPGTTAGKNEK